MTTAAEYLMRHYEEVRGMSGRFSAGISVGILELQSAAGLTGGVAEIGVFEGRFLIPLAKALHADETAIGIDTFDWPDEGVEGRCRRNMERHLNGRAWHLRSCGHDGVESSTLKPASGIEPRLIHVDADHTYASLRRDLTTALEAINVKGVVILDDMLHPAYPELYTAVSDTLKSDRRWRIACVIDRESIVAAAKFVLADRRMITFYEAHLRARFPQFVWGMRASFSDYDALVLTPSPRLARVT